MIFSTPTRTEDTTSAVRESTDHLAAGAHKAVDSARGFANDALHRAESSAREFSSHIDPVVNMLASKAQKLAQQSFDMASEAKERAHQSLTKAAGVTTRYVAEQPLRSVLIAAAVGAGVALLISATRHRDRY